MVAGEVGGRVRHDHIPALQSRAARRLSTDGARWGGPSISTCMPPLLARLNATSTRLQPTSPSLGATRSPATAGVNCPAYAAPEAVPDDRRRRAFERGAHPVGYCDWSKCFSFASIFWASATALSSWSLTLAVMSSSSAANMLFA